MYADYAPVPNCPSERVLVIEDNDTDIDAIIEEARGCGAVTEDGFDDEEIFWIVFAEDPRRLRDFTENSLRSSLKRRVTS